MDDFVQNRRIAAMLWFTLDSYLTLYIVITADPSKKLQEALHPRLLRGRRRGADRAHERGPLSRDRSVERRARAVVGPVARRAPGDVAVAPPLRRPEVAVVHDLLPAVILLREP